LQSAEGEKAFKLCVDENGNVKIDEKEIKKGYSIETIYNLFFDANDKFFGNSTEELLEIFYELLRKFKKDTISDLEKARFKLIINQLFQSSEEVTTIVNRELVQLERQTGKVLNV